SGDDIIGRPPGYGKRQRDEYRELHYHKVTDEWQEWWDLSGAVEDARLMFLVGCEVADGRTWPEWKPGAEFRERRESMLRAFRAADPWADAGRACPGRHPAWRFSCFSRCPGFSTVIDVRWHSPLWITSSCTSPGRSR